MVKKRGNEYRYESWIDVRREIEDCLRACPTFRDRVEVQGRLRRLEGLSHENYHFGVKNLENEQLLDCYIYRRISPRGVIPPSETAEYLRREAETLRALKRLGCPFRHPEVIWVATDASRPRAFIETVVEGIPGGSFVKARPESAIAEIGALAAQIHRLQKAEFLHLVHTLDSKEHLESRLKELPEAFWRQPVPRDARDWIRERAGATPRRAVIFHGDLLPQNLLFGFEGKPPGIIDWEYAGVGDAAYDLAILTRGTRKLFGQADGRKRLLAAYLEAGGQQIADADIVAHELALVAGWMWEAAERERKGRAEGESAAHYEQALQALLGRAPRG